MSEPVEGAPKNEGQGSTEPLPSPEAGFPADEVLPEQSRPIGESELAKQDVGFGPKEPGEGSSS